MLTRLRKLLSSSGNPSEAQSSSKNGFKAPIKKSGQIEKGVQSSPLKKRSVSFENGSSIMNHAERFVHNSQNADLAGEVMLRKNRKRNSLYSEMDFSAKRMSIEINAEMAQTTSSGCGNVNEAVILQSSLGNAIHEQCMLLKSDVDEINDNPAAEMNVRSVYAYLAKVAKICQSTKPTVIISPEWSLFRTTRVWNQNEDEVLPNARTMCYGPFLIFEYIVCPVYIPGHFMISIYERNKSIMFFDPLQNIGIKPEIETLVKKAVEQINGNSGRITAPIRFYHAKFYKYNKQPISDPINCGFRICLIAQTYLLNNGNTFIKDICIDAERKRIIHVLYSLLPDFNEEIPLNNELFIDPSQQVCSNDALRVCFRRSKETVEEGLNRLFEEKHKRRLTRNNESEQKKISRLSIDRQKHKVTRINEPEHQKLNRLEMERQRIYSARCNETEQQRSFRLKSDQQRKQILRSFETESERNFRIQKIKEKQQKNRLANERWYACAEKFFVEQHRLGSMNVICPCGAPHFPEEKTTNKAEFGICCHYGKVDLEYLFNYDFPVALKKMFERNDPRSNKFFEHIRSLNSSVSTASMNPMGYKTPKNRGPYIFRICGQIHHKINTALFPSSDDEPSYGQLFIVDTGSAMQSMRKSNPTVESTLLQFVYELIKEVNPFAKAYVMMKEEEEKEIEQASEEGRKPVEMQLLFGLANNMDKNKYRMPRANEVAAVFVPGADGEVPQAQIVVKERGKELQILKSTDKNVTPMCYPLFFPYGTQCWEPGMKQKNGIKNLTRLQYASYCASVRNGVFNPLLYGGKLFQQWCVDEYCKIEGDRVRWIRSNQKQIFADSYKNVDSFLQKKGKETGLPIGRKIILPSTITGSPRYIEKHYQDAMAMVRRFGKPDLFITMTCNPQWKEIQDNLFPGQTASDRPDLVVRVFYLKVKALIKEIKQKVFGLGICWMYTVEFQMRGLPHIHLLLTLGQNDKLNDGNDVDKRGISAQIPDKDAEPLLYELVSKHMIHGPCGNLNPKCPCMEEFIDKNGKKKLRCSKGFPKQFQEETIVAEKGLAIYARPNNGRFVEVRIPGGNVVKLDNRWVVPHMPYLLLRFKCHIDVEKVNNVSSVKYLHKYINKGPDRTGVEIKEINSLEHDEVKMFLDARIVTPTDALWRIFEFPTSDRSHAIKMLPVHLPGEQLYYFDENQDAKTIQNKISRNTELMAFFEINKKNALARTKYYHEIPEFFVFNDGDWKQRKRIVDDANKGDTNIIGRMVKVLPSEIERYYLRLLLLHVKGARSFEEIRTVKGVVCSTYAEACLALGLIRDDEEWKKALNEANTHMMPNQLRLFYSLILVHCGPVKPEELWNMFKDVLSEDFLRKYPSTISYALAYRDIVNKISEAGKQLTDFPTMPAVLENIDVSNEEQSLEEEREKGIKMYNGMNPKQKAIVDAIISKIDNPTNGPSFFFLNGAAGVGKTYVNNTLCSLVKGRRKKYATMAFTGIAANLLPEGRTLHNRFGLNLEMTSSKIGPAMKAWNELKEIDLFIVDESPMVDKKAFEVIDEKLREIMQNNVIFGGKIVLLTGDLRQSLPIKSHSTQAQIIDSTILKSKYWRDVKHLKLTKNMRVLSTEKQFAADLIEIGDGKWNDENDEIVLPEKCICYENLAYEIFGEAIASENWTLMSKMAILSPKNVDVSEMNSQVLNMLHGEEYFYPSIDHAENSDKQRNDEFLPEYLNSLNPSGFPPHELRLKKYSIIMLLRNMNISEGLCNGTRLVVIHMHANVLTCKTVEEYCIESEGNTQARLIHIPRITLCCDNEYPFNLIRHQFPVKLAFAMSITKSQGQTLERCGLDLRKNVFSHGQLYVGLSRVRSWDAIKIKLADDNVERKVRNIVYKEVLE